MTNEGNPGRTILFAHMMKTAGTTFTKKLARHFGARLHITQGGSFLNEAPLTCEKLKAEMTRAGRKVAIVSGHNVRPHAFSIEQCRSESLSWVTFMREPVSRFISHYYYDFARSNGFRNKKYNSMRGLSLEEWNKIENVGNYQTRFLAGSDNSAAAKEALARKFSWIGFSEEFQESLTSFASCFCLDGFDVSNKRSNARIDDQTALHKTIDLDYARSVNSMDLELYDFAKSALWPKYRTRPEAASVGPTKGMIFQHINELAFLGNRARVNQVTELNYKNMKRFLRRWFR